jgi:hypothetical protein
MFKIVILTDPFWTKLLLSLPLKGGDYKNVAFSGVTLLNNETMA